MDLYNCKTKEELKLKETDLQNLTDVELMELGINTNIDFKNGILKDENIVMEVLVQIIITQARRKAGLE